MMVKISPTVAFYGLTIAAVLLGWEIVKVPLAHRGPVPVALSVASGSPEVMRRAAEEAFIAGRILNARALAQQSLAKAPFNARALRTFGLTTANAGDNDQADAIITLAGNLSLRDDPAHAWLIERRLRQGDFGSAFAHADTLVRRRVDGNERIYDLFANAALLDERALPELSAALARNPSWRPAFVNYLVRKANADAVLLALGVTLAKTDSSYSNEELGWIYQSWYQEGRFDAIRLLRTTLGRPGKLDDLQNGSFSAQEGMSLPPFSWQFEPTSGISATIIEDDFRPNETALRVEYDGYANGIATDQILMLHPGSYRLQGQERIEISSDASRLRWRITCVGFDETIGINRVSDTDNEPTMWRTFTLAFSVPQTGCVAQRLSLDTDPGDRRATTVAWFDNLKIGVAENGGS